jgi:hypothetical protein
MIFITIATINRADPLADQRNTSFARDDRDCIEVSWYSM